MYLATTKNQRQMVRIKPPNSSQGYSPSNSWILMTFTMVIEDVSQSEKLKWEWEWMAKNTGRVREVINFHSCFCPYVGLSLSNCRVQGRTNCRIPIVFWSEIHRKIFSRDLPSPHKNGVLPSFLRTIAPLIPFPILSSTWVVSITLLAPKGEGGPVLSSLWFLSLKNSNEFDIEVCMSRVKVTNRLYIRMSSFSREIESMHIHSHLELEFLCPIPSLSLTSDWFSRRPPDTAGRI